ncbi:MAG TPA: sodium:solute symporter [Bryobacteraceae bacterium]|jgi:SSS family transporter|nr:sodium:solute symporter [Bryobacteraceae bacterium]
MRFVDLAVIAAYLIFITWFGAQFKDKQATLKSYFLGDRGAPWWAISFSIVSAETSTLTVIGTPALSIAGNFAFLQLILGYLLGRIVIALLFLPQYFRGEMFTAYELMQRRFGPRVRRFTAATFLLLRALAEGVRVFAISIVISIILGTGEIASIFVIVCLTLFYTFQGGMTAVIWTDVIQMFLYIAGAILSFFVILHLIPGGWPHVANVAGAAGKFQLFDFRFSFTAAFFRRTYSFWAGLLGGCFLTTASHGTEQLLVQRLLSARSERESRLALFSSWCVVFFQFALFLVIGVLLFVHYKDGSRALPSIPERTYPEFIWQHLPVGVAGLVIAAILAAAMSNLSAALNALSSTTIMDFVLPLRPSHAEHYYLRLARWATVAWGCVLFLIGLTARHWGSVLEAGLSVASVLYGALLGVFLLGVLTKRPGEWAAIAGMAAGFSATFLLRQFVAYTWYVLIGSFVTFAVGYLASIIAPTIFAQTVVKQDYSSSHAPRTAS